MSVGSPTDRDHEHGVVILEFEIEVTESGHQQSIPAELADRRRDANLIGLVEPDGGGDLAPPLARDEDIFAADEHLGEELHHVTRTTTTAASSWRTPASHNSTELTSPGDRLTKPGNAATRQRLVSPS